MISLLFWLSVRLSRDMRQNDTQGLLRKENSPVDCF